MDGSILNDVKLGIGGIEANCTDFDGELILMINGVLNKLVQIGIGLRDFTISDATAKWSDFVSNDLPHLQDVKMYVTLRVKLLFDPPSSSYVMQNIKDECNEIGWRLNVEMDPGSEGLY